MNGDPELRPAIHPAEPWRRALLDKVLAEAVRVSRTRARPDAGTLDTRAGDPVEHVTAVTDPWTGVTSVAADVEPVNQDVVRRNARFVLDALAREQRHPAGWVDDPQA